MNMRCKCLRSLWCALLPGLVFLAASSAAPGPLTQFKLANGLTVILNEDHTKAEVFGLVVVKAGSKHDPADATGLAHYQEHMLFKGTTELGTRDWPKEKEHLDQVFALYDQLGATSDPARRREIQARINEASVAAGAYAIPNELDGLLKRIGSTGINANTTWDRTVYFNTFPANEIVPWLDLCSHRFMNPVFRLFQSELETVYEEKNLYSDSFEERLMEFLFRNFFRKHPYGRQGPLGTVAHLKSPSLTKMREFFQTRYVAPNMALVLSGDFDAAAVRPVIEAKFAPWRSTAPPAFDPPAEQPFHGRETASARLTPVKIALLGFRAPKAGDPDEIAMQLCNGILANPGGNGLLDGLMLQHKLLAAQPVYVPFDDQGGCMIITVPKFPFQTLGSAERLVRAELDRLGRGDFDEALLEGVKRRLYIQHCKALESNEQRGNLLAACFTRGEDPARVFDYPARVRAATREEVLRAARRYYGPDYLCAISRMGFGKPEKLKKPGYQPILPPPGARSAYAARFESIPAAAPVLRPLDFDKDIARLPLPGGGFLNCVSNPCNDVFSLKIQHGLGAWKRPRLRQAAEAMNFAGAASLDSAALKEALSRLGCTCQFSADDSYTTIELEGVEAGFAPALELVRDLMLSPRIERAHIEMIADAARAERKIEDAPDPLAQALYEYTRRGPRSGYLRRLSLSEIKHLTPGMLADSFQEALRVRCDIHYTGKARPEAVRSLLLQHLPLAAATGPSDSPIALDILDHPTNEVYFLAEPKAVQSKIRFLINGSQIPLDQEPCADAFAQYLFGGFSGILLQEVREFRSLAYNADGACVIPRKPGVRGYLAGGLSTQADKTSEALEVLAGILANLPAKPERIPALRAYLDQAAQTEHPGFRERSECVQAWRLRGYSTDPLPIKARAWQGVEFTDLARFYSNQFQGRPVALSIVGDPRRVDVNALARYGRVIPVKRKDILR